MKRIIMFVLLFAALKVAGQTTGYLRFDTVKIMKQNGSCELYIINKTKDSLGLLTNVGGGLTRFIKSKVLNDSTIVIGRDTLVVKGTGSGGTPPGGDEYSIQFKNGSSLGGDSIKYNPTTNNLVMTKSFLQFGRPITGFFTTSDAISSSGYLGKVFPRGSGGTGADTLNYFYQFLETSRYDLARGENAVITLWGSKNDASIVPRASIRVEDDFYDDWEYHAFATTPRHMPNPNSEIRHWSWNCGRTTGLSVLATRASSTYWNESTIGSTFDRQYALLNPGSGFTLHTWQNAISGFSVVNGNGALTEISGSFTVDTANMSLDIQTNANATSLNLGTGWTIGNPATTGGTMIANKNTTINNKLFLVSNLSNGVTGLGVQSTAIGYIFSVSTDGGGFADVATTGKHFINRDNTISESTRLLGIYNHYNTNDSIFHVRGNGDLWTKGMISARGDSTTSATGGFLYRDAITGNFRITAPPGGITSINAHTGPAIIVQGGTGISVDNSVANTATIEVTPNSTALPHTLDAVYTTAGNSGTSETDLFTYTLEAGKLAIDGRTMNFEIDGEFNDNTITAQLRLYFGGNVTLNTGAVSVSTAFTKWKITGYVMRTSSSTAHVTYEMQCPGLATPIFLGYSNLTSLDFTTTNVFKITAQAAGGGASNSDITAHSWQLLYKPQPQ